MKKKIHAAESIFSIKVYLRIFFTILITLTISFVLFFRMMNLEISEGITGLGAAATIGNICFLSMLLTMMNGIQRKKTVEEPVRKILEATEQIAAGNYDVRISSRNISEDKYNEFDLIIENFNTMAKELSGTEILRNDFISNVSHEFKSPLAAIQNYSVLLQDPALPADKRKEYAQAVNYSCVRLSSLITNILKLNKLENQQIFAKPQKFDLSEQICESMLGFEMVWEKKNIDIDADIDQDIFVESDPELLSLVWNNLLSNALKFTNEGGKVSVSLKEVGDSAVVKISDTGCGISKEAQKQIFEKFYQADSSHASEGNGLGLALVKTVLDKVDGELELRSEEGKGSEFSVKIKR